MDKFKNTTILSENGEVAFGINEYTEKNYMTFKKNVDELKDVEAGSTVYLIEDGITLIKTKCNPNEPIQTHLWEIIPHSEYKRNHLDWGENDPISPCYIANRPMYTKDDGTVIKIPKKYLPEGSGGGGGNGISDWDQNDPEGEGYIRNRPFFRTGVPKTAEDVQAMDPEQGEMRPFTLTNIFKAEGIPEEDLPPIFIRKKDGAKIPADPYLADYIFVCGLKDLFSDKTNSFSVTGQYYKDNKTEELFDISLLNNLKVKLYTEAGEGSDGQYFLLGNIPFLEEQMLSGPGHEPKEIVMNEADGLFAALGVCDPRYSQAYGVDMLIDQIYLFLPREESNPLSVSASTVNVSTVSYQYKSLPQEYLSDYSIDFDNRDTSQFTYLRNNPLKRFVGPEEMKPLQAQCEMYGGSGGSFFIEPNLYLAALTATLDLSPPDGASESTKESYLEEVELIVNSISDKETYPISFDLALSIKDIHSQTVLLPLKTVSGVQLEGISAPIDTGSGSPDIQYGWAKDWPFSYTGDPETGTLTMPSDWSLLWAFQGTVEDIKKEQYYDPEPIEENDKYKLVFSLEIAANWPEGMKEEDWEPFVGNENAVFSLDITNWMLQEKIHGYMPLNESYLPQFKSSSDLLTIEHTKSKKRLDSPKPAEYNFKFNDTHLLTDQYAVETMVESKVITPWNYISYDKDGMGRKQQKSFIPYLTSASIYDQPTNFTGRMNIVPEQGKLPFTLMKDRYQREGNVATVGGQSSLASIYTKYNEETKTHYLFVSGCLKDQFYFTYTVISEDIYQFLQNSVILSTSDPFSEYDIFDQENSIYGLNYDCLAVNKQDLTNVVNISWKAYEAQNASQLYVKKERANYHGYFNNFENVEDLQIMPRKNIMGTYKNAPTGCFFTLTDKSTHQQNLYYYDNGFNMLISNCQYDEYSNQLLFEENGTATYRYNYSNGHASDSLHDERIYSVNGYGHLTLKEEKTQIEEYSRYGEKDFYITTNKNESECILHFKDQTFSLDTLVHYHQNWGNSFYSNDLGLFYLNSFKEIKSVNYKDYVKLMFVTSYNNIVITLHQGESFKYILDSVTQNPYQLKYEYFNYDTPFNITTSTENGVYMLENGFDCWYKPYKPTLQEAIENLQSPTSG